MQNVDQILDYVSKVEVSAFGLASAEKPDGEAGQNDSAAKDEKGEKDSSDKGGSPLSGTNKKRRWTTEEINFFSRLEDRKAKLDYRESELEKLEEELQRQRVEIENKIKQLEKMRGDVANILKERISVDSSKVDKLVAFYSNMKPQQAAKIFEAIDEELAIEVLGRLKKKNAAEILNLIQPAKARRLSEKYAGYKR